MHLEICQANKKRIASKPAGKQASRKQEKAPHMRTYIHAVLAQLNPKIQTVVASTGYQRRVRMLDSGFRVYGFRVRRTCLSHVLCKLIDGKGPICGTSPNSKHAF